MLGQPEHLDKEDLEQLADQEWSGARARASLHGQALSRHLKNLLDNGEVRSSARRGASLPRRAAAWVLRGFRRCCTGSSSASIREQEGLRLDQLVGLDLEKVFKRKSGASFSAPIPRLYSRDVFKQFTGSGAGGLVKQLSEEAWVWGETFKTALSSAGTVVTNVMVIYEKDYVRVWNAILDDLEFAPCPHRLLRRKRRTAS